MSAPRLNGTAETDADHADAVSKFGRGVAFVSLEFCVGAGNVSQSVLVVNVEESMQKSASVGTFGQENPTRPHPPSAARSGPGGRTEPRPALVSGRVAPLAFLLG